MPDAQCTLSGLGQLDTADFEAVMRMNQACLEVLLDPVLWAWMLGLTVVCIAGGALVGWIKGRTLAGVVWAALLGPIGWIIVALSPSRLPPCPECGKGNPVNARRCRHCGVDTQRSRQRTARSRLKGADSGGSW